MRLPFRVRVGTERSLFILASLAFDPTRALAKGEHLPVPPFRRDIAAKLFRDPAAR